MTSKKHNIIDLGFDDKLKDHKEKNGLNGFSVGRVSLVHKERYVVLNDKGEFDCELIGKLRYATQNKEDFPVVGDWVAYNEYDINKGLIHAIYPRKNSLERQAVGQTGEKQIIGSNIDVGLIVQSVNRDFSINRLERYVTICYTSGIKPIIVINKIDLIENEQLSEIITELEYRISDVKIIPMSNITGEGLDLVKSIIKKRNTYCLLGSSGVGKSSLINSLAGNNLMKTGVISESIDRGKHITSHRELVVLESGGVIIDNPGMREVGITESSVGLEKTYEKIHELAESCKFNDCNHQNDKGCAILKALELDQLSKDTYDNFMKLKREQTHFSSSVHEKRKKQKAFGKMIKQFVDEKNKYRM